MTEYRLWNIQLVKAQSKLVSHVQIAYLIQQL